MWSVTFGHIVYAKSRILNTLIFNNKQFFLHLSYFLRYGQQFSFFITKASIALNMIKSQPNRYRQTDAVYTDISSTMLVLSLGIFEYIQELFFTRMQFQISHKVGISNKALYIYHLFYLLLKKLSTKQKFFCQLKGVSPRSINDNQIRSVLFETQVFEK